MSAADWERLGGLLRDAPKADNGRKSSHESHGTAVRPDKAKSGPQPKKEESSPKEAASSGKGELVTLLVGGAIGAAVGAASLIQAIQQSPNVDHFDYIPGYIGGMIIFTGAGATFAVLAKEFLTGEIPLVSKKTGVRNEKRVWREGFYTTDNGKQRGQEFMDAEQKKSEFKASQ
jgi:hypothetical protein